MITVQGSLFAMGFEVEVRELESPLERTDLASGAWVDVRRSWIGGADVLFDLLVESVPWRAEQRPMYERVVDVPRLLAFYEEGVSLPHESLEIMRDELRRHYRSESGGDLRTAGLCLYRDGRDSVAWHGDRFGRGRHQDVIVAIVSLGQPRALLLRPVSGGPSRRYVLGSGDLLVMGGSCQRTWQHCVPKTARPIGPRMSVQFRAAGVR